MKCLIMSEIYVLRKWIIQIKFVSQARVNIHGQPPPLHIYMHANLFK